MAPMSERDHRRGKPLEIGISVRPRGGRKMVPADPGTLVISVVARFDGSL
jgi:hypothetical protein